MMRQKITNPAPSWTSRACSSRLPSSMDHQPRSLNWEIVKMQQELLHSCTTHSMVTLFKLTILPAWNFLLVGSRSHYLEPWCRNPKQSWALEEYVKYLPVPAPLCSKRTIFSTNLDAENRTPAPWSKKIGEKRTGIGISLAAAGVPWNVKPL